VPAATERARQIRHSRVYRNALDPDLCRKDFRQEDGERVLEPDRDEHPERAAADEEEQALCDELTDLPRAAAAERRANGDLSLACGKLRRQQQRDVGACDQQQECDRTHERERTRPSSSMKQSRARTAVMEPAQHVGITRVRSWPKVRGRHAPVPARRRERTGQNEMERSPRQTGKKPRPCHGTWKRRSTPTIATGRPSSRIVRPSTPGLPQTPSATIDR
jgi:hypothetical protein